MSASSVAPAARYRSRSRWQHFSVQQAPLLLSLAILAGTFGVYVGLFVSNEHHFLTSFEGQSIVNGALPLVFAAVGQTIVVMTRGLDLSVGGVMALTNTIVASNMHASTGSMIAWSLIGLLIGGGAGLLNGCLVAFGRLQPILVTLATLSIFDGLAIKVLPEPGGAIPPEYTKIMANTTGPWGLVFVLVVLCLWFVFRRTPLGVAVYAIGNDEGAARASGIKVRRAKVSAYVVAGMLFSAGALFFSATTTAGDATASDPFILTSIAAVVLGGISFFGGRGSAVGAVAGAFALSLVTPVLFFAHVDQLYTDAFQGLFLVLAVVLAGLVGRLVRVRS
jgi:ribose transport system permease protein